MILVKCEFELVGCHAVIWFLYLKGRTPQETYDEMKEIYGNDALSYDLVKCYHHEFKPGLISEETAPRPGNPLLPLVRHLLVEFRLPFSMIDM